MNRFNDNEDKIKDALKHMPKIKDDLNKDQLYQRISSEVNQPEKSHKKKRFAFAPVMSAVIAAGVLLLLVPLFVNDTMIQDNNDRSADQALDKTISNESSDSGEEAGSPAESNREEGETILMTDKSSSNVIQETGDNEMIIHGAVADLQGQYIIPLSLVVSDSVEKEQFYGEIGDYLDEEAWGLSNYMFSNVDVQLDVSSRQAQIDLPDDFSPVTYGSLEASLFEDLLAATFLPIQVDHVIFSTPVNLGQIGTVKELPLQQTKNIYKHYQAPKSDRGFLVQVPIDDQASFETALSEMKRDEEEFNVSGTIPESADFSVQKNGSQLQVDFTNSEISGDGETLTTMIDAILMTAKSFGYEDVLFSNLPDDNVNSYDLSAPVKVPEGVNPITPE